MTTIEDKNIPSRREQSLIQVKIIYASDFGSPINLFITFCDYNEEKKIFNAVCP